MPLISKKRLEKLRQDVTDEMRAQGKSGDEIALMELAIRCIGDPAYRHKFNDLAIKIGHNSE